MKESKLLFDKKGRSSEHFNADSVKTQYYRGKLRLQRGPETATSAAVKKARLPTEQRARFNKAIFDNAHKTMHTAAAAMQEAVSKGKEGKQFLNGSDNDDDNRELRLEQQPAGNGSGSSSFSIGSKTGKVSTEKMGAARLAGHTHSDATKKAELKVQKKRYNKKRYASIFRAKRLQAVSAAKDGIDDVRKTVKTVTPKQGGFFGLGKYLRLTAILVCVLFFALVALLGGFAAVGAGGAAAVATVAAYPAAEADILAAEAHYCALESDMRHSIEVFQEEHDYNEYHFKIDKIEHDPYVLISMISAMYQPSAAIKGDEDSYVTIPYWCIDDVTGLMQTIFSRQYIRSETVTIERRTRIETDPETGVETEVEYDHSICTVTIENFNLSHLPVHIMIEEQLTRYAVYMRFLGGRPDLFPGSKYVSLYYENPPEPYTVDPALIAADEQFAAILREAKKYIGFPYVWGGYNPNTSFDCSGFVSWVLNHSGWSVGRLGAQGLYGICTPIDRAAARPGDLIFFTKTYSASYPVTHVGIYVGGGMMLHCGDPIQFASFETPYFQSHFYSFGRLPPK